MNTQYFLGIANRLMFKNSIIIITSILFGSIYVWFKEVIFDTTIILEIIPLMIVCIIVVDIIATIMLPVKIYKLHFKNNYAYINNHKINTGNIQWVKISVIKFGRYNIRMLRIRLNECPDELLVTNNYKNDFFIYDKYNLFDLFPFLNLGIKHRKAKLITLLRSYCISNIEDDIFDKNDL